jgi:hypothetical protein
MNRAKNHQNHPTTPSPTTSTCKRSRWRFLEPHSTGLDGLTRRRERTEKKYCLAVGLTKPEREAEIPLH